MPSWGTSALKETAAVCQGLDTPPPTPHHVQGCCQELGEAASGFQLPIFCLSQPWSLAGGSSLQQGEISGVSLLGTKAPHSEGQGR